MKRGTWIILGWLVLPVTAQAASFDCGKAAIKVEKIICGDAKISKLDEELNAAYKIAMQDKKQANTVKQGQKQWMKKRNACSDEACLVDAYTTRITRLSPANKNWTHRESQYDIEVCQTIVDYTNRGELTKLYVSKDKEIQPKIENLFGQLSGGTTIWFVDLNNDGVPDPFIINVDGTAHISNGHAISSKDANVIADVDSDESDLSLLAVNGKYYVLSSNENDIKTLLHLTDKGFETVCKFTQRDKPHVEISKGKENPVCAAALAGNIKHIDFKPVNNEAVNFGEVVIGLSVADVDNYGKPENISLVDYESSAGRGCSSLMIRAIDKEMPERAAFINKILATTIDGCNVKQGVFSYGELTYIDEGLSTILLIKDKKAEEVCSFKVRPLFDVQR